MIVKNNNGNHGQRWAVVGGGMLGLTMAHRMSAAGHNVTLIEAAPTLGGLASYWQLGDIIWEKHYHVILLSDSRLRNLLEEVNLAKELKWVETKTGFFTDGKLHSMSNTKEFLNFPPLTLIEKLRLGGTIFYASKIRNWKRLEKMPVDKWLQRWSGKGTFEKIWQPLLRAKLGEAYKETAASFIWAHINRMYKARRSGLKKEMFGYVRGGYRTVIDRLADRIEQQGGEILADHPISEVSKQADGTFKIDFANQPSQHFDKVVMTTPSNVIAKTCTDLGEEELAKLQSVKYLGIVNASMLIEKKLSPYYVTNITDTWVPMTAIIELSNIIAAEETGGKSLVYLPKYVPADNEMFEKTDEEVKESFLAAVEKMIPEFSRDQVAAFKISRVRNVMAIPTQGYSESLPDQASSVDGLFLVNSAYITKGNLNVNETITIAENALDGCLKEELASDLIRAKSRPTNRRPVAV